MRVDKFFHKAAAEALKSDLEIKHGAILVSGGKMVAAGHNSSRAAWSGAPSPLAGTRGACSMHSEVAALHAASCVL